MSIFSHISVPRLRRSVYRFNFEHKLSFRMGNLIPLKFVPIVPGDHIYSLSVESFTRMAPMIFPVMHRMNIKLYAFYVPHRIVWSGWNDFIFGGPDGDLEPSMPHFLMSDLWSNNALKEGFGSGSLADYLGFPWQNFKSGANPVGTRKIKSLKYRTYQMIWNEYFRDQNLEDALELDFDREGHELDVDMLSTLRKKAWQKDYFTSALPWLQRGPATVMPVNLDMSGVDIDIRNSSYKEPLEYQSPDGSSLASGAFMGVLKEGGNQTVQSFVGTQDVYPSNLSQYLDAVLTDANPDAASFLVEDLRRALSTQIWRERNARGGARPNEQLLAHFGVRSSDARLQRPEFLGATSAPISISEVLQSSESTQEGTPLGEMGGHGISARGNLLCKNKFFEEHGYLAVLMTCIPKTGYFQGLDKDDDKFDRFDYWWPEFAHIGEQPIMKSELLFNAQNDDEVFGYTPRYAEYQYIPDTVAGEFRDTLKSWHMAREITDASLNASFVHCNPTDRIFPVQYRDVEQMYGQFLFHLNMKRSILKGANPR